MVSMSRIRIIALFLFVSTSAPAAAQSTEEALRDDLLLHFEQLASKATQLSEAFPSELYAWSPGEGVMTAGHVLAHISRYNYLYLSENLGVGTPDGIDLERMEEVRDKEHVVGMLTTSVDHARRSISGLSAAELSSDTRLYGRDVKGWAALVQLVSHLGEHVGQLVAYSRMNDIVPPWSS